MVTGKETEAVIGEGTQRLMTLGEITMAQKVFGHSISYNRVWIHCDSYLPFGLQNPDYAMTPNGEIWFREKNYKSDFSISSVRTVDKWVFIHELGHVWQHQHGQWVRLRGTFSWAANYTYDLDKEKLMDYSLEQQASILADYWLLLVYGIEQWHFYQNRSRFGKYRGRQPLKDVPILYKKIVTSRGQ